MKNFYKIPLTLLFILSFITSYFNYTIYSSENNKIDIIIEKETKEKVDSYSLPETLPLVIKKVNKNIRTSYKPKSLNLFISFLPSFYLSVISIDKNNILLFNNENKYLTKENKLKYIEKDDF